MYGKRVANKSWEDWKVSCLGTVLGGILSACTRKSVSKCRLLTRFLTRRHIQPSLHYIQLTFHPLISDITWQFGRVCPNYSFQVLQQSPWTSQFNKFQPACFVTSQFIFSGWRVNMPLIAMFGQPVLMIHMKPAFGIDTQILVDFFDVCRQRQHPSSDSTFLWQVGETKAAFGNNGGVDYNDWNQLTSHSDLQMIQNHL